MFKIKLKKFNFEAKRKIKFIYRKNKPIHKIAKIKKIKKNKKNYNKN